MTLLALALAAVVVLPAAAKVPGQSGRIAFARVVNPDTGDSITYTANPDGSQMQQLFSADFSDAPHWSPDGSLVAVNSGLGIPCPPTCTGNTVIVNPDTGDYRVITPEGFPAISNFCTIWSPDATQFACDGENDNDPSVNGVYRIRSSDGGGLTRITNAGGAIDIPIDYSPDGKQIVFGRLGENHSCGTSNALYVVNVDGSGLHRITPGGFCDDDGSWSPDGSEIAFEHRGSLFVVHPDGSGLAKIPLATNSRAFAGDFSWSPDGERIAFLLFTPTSSPSGGPHANFQEGIATANADGRDVQMATTGSTFDHEADWGSHPLVK
jgi:Tol biopolymer transport system component